MFGTKADRLFYFLQILRKPPSVKFQLSSLYHCLLTGKSLQFFRLRFTLLRNTRFSAIRKYKVSAVDILLSLFCLCTFLLFFYYASVNTEYGRVSPCRWLLNAVLNVFKRKLNVIKRAVSLWLPTFAPE